MDKSIKRMIQDLARRRYSEKTKELYLWTVNDLSRRFGHPVANLTVDEIRTYADEIVSAGKSSSWVKIQFAALRFLYRKTLWRPELVSFLSYPKQYSMLPTVLSLDEVDALLHEIRNPRYQAVVKVMYGAGLRISEALALEVTDIDGARGVIRVRHGKGNKAREAKLSNSMLRMLRQYWALERPPLPYLFASKKTQKPPVADTIRRAIADAAKRASLTKHVTPHVMRHSFATHLLEEGTDIRVVGALLGHASLESTARYARVTDKLVSETPSPLDLLPKNRRR